MNPTISNDGNVISGVYIPNMGQEVTYFKCTVHASGVPMTDSLCDGTIYRKYQGEYWVMSKHGEFEIELFGAIGDDYDDSDDAWENAPAYRKAVAFILSVGGGKLKWNNSRYRQRSTVLLNAPSQIPVTIQGGCDAIRNNNSVLSGTILRMSTAVPNDPGTMFYTNKNANGSSFLGPTDQWAYLTVKDMNFAAVGAVTGGIRAFDMFRTRCVFENITTQRIDHLVYQADNDGFGHSNYCDVSTYKNIFLTNCTLGGLLLYGADASDISGVRMERAFDTFKHMIEIRNSRAFTIDNYLHWTPNLLVSGVPITDSALIDCTQCEAFTITSGHIERCNLESVFRFNSCRGFKIEAFSTIFSTFNTFNFNFACQNAKISNWVATSDTAVGYFDLVQGADSTSMGLVIEDALLRTAAGVTKTRTTSSASTRQGGSFRDRFLTPLIIVATDVLVLERSNSIVELFDSTNPAQLPISLPSAALNDGAFIDIINRTTTSTYRIDAGLDPNVESPYLIPRFGTTYLRSIGGVWIIEQKAGTIASQTGSASANYSAPSTNRLLTLPSRSSADGTVTLLPATNRQGDRYWIRTTNTSIYDWVPVTNIIDFSGSAIAVFPKRSAMEIMSDGTNWNMVSFSAIIDMAFAEKKVSLDAKTTGTKATWKIPANKEFTVEKIKFLCTAANSITNGVTFSLTYSTTGDIMSGIQLIGLYAAGDVFIHYSEGKQVVLNGGGSGATITLTFDTIATGTSQVITAELWGNLS